MHGLNILAYMRTILVHSKARYPVVDDIVHMFQNIDAANRLVAICNNSRFQEQAQ